MGSKGVQGGVGDGRAAGSCCLVGGGWVLFSALGRGLGVKGREGMGGGMGGHWDTGTEGQKDTGTGGH